MLWLRQEQMRLRCTALTGSEDNEMTVRCALVVTGSDSETEMLWLQQKQMRLRYKALTRSE